MRYAFLLYPHANARYRASLLTLARAELSMMLAAMGRACAVEAREIAGAPFLCLETEEFREREWALLSRQGGVYLLCRMEGDALVPMPRAGAAYVGEDMAALLKYKGKTNEMFTDTLLSMALASSAFALKGDAKLAFCDPMCGKGTALYLALRRGWNAAGVDADRHAIKEADDFTGRYLAFHHLKHKRGEGSLTVRGQAGGRETKYVFADTPEHYRDGDTRTLRLIQGDTRDLDVLLRPGSVQIMAVDLPYGVQHGPADHRGGILPLLERAAPAWHAALASGGALAASFNTYVTRRAQVIRALEAAGFDVLRGEAYDGLEHWVEQAVNRDVVVARRI